MGQTFTRGRSPRHRGPDDWPSRADSWSGSAVASLAARESRNRVRALFHRISSCAAALIRRENANRSLRTLAFGERQDRELIRLARTTLAV